MTHHRIAIIGAGMAGLACARRLHCAGMTVELFDKAARAGGRMASRALSLAHGTTMLDHGAQYFTARDPDFRTLCNEALTAGVIEPWTAALRDERNAVQVVDEQEARYRGYPDMNALPRWLAQGLALQCRAEVRELHRGSAGWSLQFTDGRAEAGFAAVVVTLPAEQTAVLLKNISPLLATQARSAHSAPCWAGLFGFAHAARWPAWQALRLPEHHCLGWLARSRDGRALIAHATPQWTRAHLEQAPDIVQAALLAAVHECAPDLGTPEFATVHRWRYALVERAADAPYGFDPAMRLAVCGDWLLGPRVEFAWMSGNALGAHLPGLLHNATQA